jgi:hypothetical protein
MKGQVRDHTKNPQNRIDFAARIRQKSSIIAHEGESGIGADSVAVQIDNWTHHRRFEI